MSGQNGKGDKPRPFSNYRKYLDNHSDIEWRAKGTYCVCCKSDIVKGVNDEYIWDHPDNLTYCNKCWTNDFCDDWRCSNCHSEFVTGVNDSYKESYPEAPLCNKCFMGN